MATAAGDSTLDPDSALDFGSRSAAETYATKMRSPRSNVAVKIVPQPKKSPVQLQREIDEALAGQPSSGPTEIALEASIAKARAKASQSNQLQSIWLTRDGEYRIRSASEKVSPLWTLVQHVSS